MDNKPGHKRKILLLKVKKKKKKCVSAQEIKTEQPRLSGPSVFFLSVPDFTL